MTREKELARARQAATGDRYTTCLEWVRDSLRPDARCTCGIRRFEHEAIAHVFDYAGTHGPLSVARAPNDWDV